MAAKKLDEYIAEFEVSVGSVLEEDLEDVSDAQNCPLHNEAESVRELFMESISDNQQHISRQSRRHKSYDGEKRKVEGLLDELGDGNVDGGGEDDESSVWWSPGASLGKSSRNEFHDLRMPQASEYSEMSDFGMESAKSSESLASVLDEFRRGLSLPAVRRRPPSELFWKRAAYSGSNAIQVQQKTRESLDHRRDSSRVGTKSLPTFDQPVLQSGFSPEHQEELSLFETILETDSWVMKRHTSSGTITFVHRHTGRTLGTLPTVDISSAQQQGFRAAMRHLDGESPVVDGSAQTSSHETTLEQEAQFSEAAAKSLQACLKHTKAIQATIEYDLPVLQCTIKASFDLTERRRVRGRNERLDTTTDSRHSEALLRMHQSTCTVGDDEPVNENDGDDASDGGELSLAELSVALPGDQHNLSKLPSSQHFARSAVSQSPAETQSTAVLHAGLPKSLWQSAKT